MGCVILKVRLSLHAYIYLADAVIQSFFPGTTKSINEHGWVGNLAQGYLKVDSVHWFLKPRTPGPFQLGYPKPLSIL